MISANLLPLANHLWQSTLFAAAVWLLAQPMEMRGTFLGS